MPIVRAQSDGTSVVVPSVPPLSTIPNVELMHTGEWNLSSGTATFTQDDLLSAVSALDCPAIRRPILKLGHTDSRFDGEPACGYISNMSVTNDGNSLVGDYVGMPGWLGNILPSAYPDRSIEAAHPFKCQIGHIHPFVITAVAFLGVTPPGIGTLESLQDIAAMYGVAASEGVEPTQKLVIHYKGEPMPNKPKQIQAAVSTEDIRRAFYEQNPGYDTWICEMQMDPLQLIVCNDLDGSYSRVPVSITGDDDFEFGEAVDVKMVYQDVPTKAAAKGDSQVAVSFSSKMESQKGFTDLLTKPDPESISVPAKTTSNTTPNKLAAIEQIHRAANQPNSKKEGTGMDPGRLREALELPADATDQDVTTALVAAGFGAPAQVTDPDSGPAPAPVPVAAGAQLPEGVMAIDMAVVRGLQEQAAKGEAAFREIQKSRRDGTISAAIQDGRFPPSRKEHWERLWDADPEGTEKQINQLAKGLVPIQASGYPGTETFEQDQNYYAMYPEERPSNG
jgi:hypothetical protein